MKISISKLILLLVITTCVHAYAEIYTWVDKDGKKHFGQEIPKEYANQGKALEVKPINSMDETKVTKTSSPKPAKPTYQQPRRFVPEEDSSNRNLSRCEQQKLAYEKSVKCYSDCRNLDAQYHGVNNVSSCGHCVDAKKPNCS